ncbi:MAG: formylglycine-generating enzyme family protein [Planctomycetaceae bacterium]|nr:formylglycine-generating enzyme family protein [Planctomycetaceae bacterium]
MGYNHSGGYEELLVAFPRSITPRDTAGDERPRHRVRISQPFEMSIHEVTVHQFRVFCNETGYRTTAEINGEGIVGFAPITAAETLQTGKRHLFARRPEFLWQSPGFEQTDSHPVVGVSWNDATAFCRWLSQKESVTCRLPTEAEWEYACRAGTETWFNFGNSFRNEIQRHANIADLTLEKLHPELAMRQWLIDFHVDPEDHFAFTAPTGSFEPNRWELYDMHGNVWEWCQDSYRDDSYQGRIEADNPTIDPLNTKSQDELDDWQVIRGGSWCNGPILCRSGTRGFFAAGDASCYIGFRIVREIDSQ